MQARYLAVLGGCVSFGAVAAGVTAFGTAGTSSSRVSVVRGFMATPGGPSVAGAAAAPAQLTADGVTMTFPASGDGSGGYGVSIAGAGAATVSARQPVQVFVCTDAECPADGSGNESVAQTPVDHTSYDSVVASGTDVVAKATVTSQEGTRFEVDDVYSVAGAQAPGAFKLVRRVTVAARGGTDRGFTSKFSMAFATASARKYHVFSPAIWYDQNSDVAPAWFGGTKEKSAIYWRETRAGLPLVMLQDPDTGSALTIVHTAAKPSSLVDESQTGWLVSSDIRHGSLGIENAAQAAGGPTSIGFTYPANETAMSATPDVKWIRRSNLITNNYYQQYTLLLSLKPGSDSDANRYINAAMADAWRLAYVALRPAYRSVAPQTVYDTGIGLIKDWSRNRKNDAQGVPGRVFLPQGPSETELAGDNWAYVMGYVGEQIPLGFQLFWRGITRLPADADMRAKGATMLDFWANKAAQANTTPDKATGQVPSGLPFTWYAVATGAWQHETKSGCTQDTMPIFLRYLGDGMEAMVSAAAVGEQNGFAHPNWEHFATGFGDWLVDHQVKDTKTSGYWYRAYNPDGTRYTNSACQPNATSGDVTQNTTHVIRFLAQLYKATNDTRYRDAAVFAGNYAIAHSYGVGKYTGGTTDTPNIEDREGGIIATRAALALYDATGNADWLKWARQAAVYAETWTYAYDFSIANPSAPQQSGPLGMSLISTGQSGADISASLLSYDLFRLYLADPANDDHFRDAALLLESTTKYSTQLPGVAQQSFGYGHDGLLGEANSWFRMAGNNSGKGSAFQWLPWLTNAELDPLQRMQDRFKTMSIQAALTSNSLANLQTMNRAGLPGPFPNWKR